MKSARSCPLLLAWMVCFAGAADCVPIFDVQYTTAPSGDSPYVGQVVTVTGSVTAVFYDGYILAESPGPWHALYVQSRRDGPRVGDEVSVTGTVFEFGKMTVINNVTAFSVLSTGNEIAASWVNALSAAQEMYESVLISVPNVTVTGLMAGGEWTISDGTAEIRCDNMNDYMYFPRVGDALDSVTGQLFCVISTFKIQPRGTFDISGDPIPRFALFGDVVTMDDALSVAEDTYLVIEGDRIVGIESGAPGGMAIVDVEGLVFPGLIDGHNHASWNALDIIPFGMTFSERYEWQATPMYADFKTQMYAVWDYGGTSAQVPNVYKLAEGRALCAGTTTIQSVNCNGSSYDYFAHQGMVIGNAERFPGRVYDSVFPLSETQASWAARKAENWERFVIHLSEGTSAAALDEFYSWIAWGMLDWRTTIVHGVPYGPSEWALMAAADASLVWAPASNWRLHGACVDIPGALAAGVNVAIAPDWTESGCRDMLAEMKYGYELGNTLWPAVLEPADFALFATRNAARAMGADDRAGRIATGYRADLMVIPGDPQDPYQALLDADQSDVRLTVVSGRPMYGDSELMDQFSFLGTTEEMVVCGRAKKLAIQIDAYSIPSSDKPMSQVVSELQDAYDNAFPQICDFLGPVYCSSADVKDATLGDQVLSVHPNPFETEATVSLFLGQKADVSLRIYDVTGRVVRTLVNGSLDPGGHALIWDGRNNKGERQAAGVYLVEFSAEAGTMTSRLVLLR